MKALLFLFLCLATNYALAQTPKKPGSQTSAIEIKGGNNNVVKVIQAGVVVKYDLTRDQDAHKLLGYLRSLPSISKQLDQVEKEIRQIGQVEKNQNKLLLEIARNTAREGFISIETYNQGLEKYITENNKLKAEIVQLKAKYQDTEFAAVLAQAEEKLKQLDNEGYQQILEEFKGKRKARIEQEKREIGQVAYLQAQNSQNQFQYNRALQQIVEAIKYDDKNPKYFVLKGEVLTRIYHIQEALDTYLQINYDLLDDTLRGRISHNIGLAYSSKGEYDKALENHNKSLATWRKVLGEEHPDAATSYNNIGIAYASKGDYEKALENYNKALVIRLKILGEEHPTVATSYNNIGITYSDQGKNNRALENYNKALTIWLKAFGEQHPNVATSYNNIGAIYADQGQYDRALENYDNALIIWLKVFGEEHPDVARSYNNIGLAYSSKREYTRALKNHNKALGIRLKVLGEQHPDVATSYNNIGIVYADQRENDRALENYNKAMIIWLKAFGEQHPNVALSYNNIGAVYHSKGYYDKALENYNKALGIRLKAFGKKHPDTQETIRLISDIINNQKK